MQRPSEPPFDFAHLIDVQPLLRTARDGDFALTIDSIERYEHGFVLVMWVEAAEGPLHVFEISAQDDAGNSYGGSTLAGYGSGSPEARWVNRVVYSFAPPLDPMARTLTLVIANARRLRLALPWTQREDVVNGPWEFAFDLTQASEPNRTVTSPRRDAAQPVDHAPSGTPTLPPSIVRNVAHGPGEPPPRFEPAHLQRVIPVGQQQEVERFAISVLSLEFYADGFVAVVRTDYPDSSLRQSRPFGWKAEDDRGGIYRFRGAPGSGGGAPGKAFTWRVDCQFTPALNQDARELRLWLDGAEMSNGYARPEPEPETYLSISGRWEFVIPL